MRSILLLIAFGLNIFLTVEVRAAALCGKVHVLKGQARQGALAAIESYKSLMGLQVMGESPRQLDYARHHFHRLSESQIEQLKVLIRNNYKLIKALKNEDGAFSVFKRHLDLHLSEILNAKSFFKKRLQSNPDKALEALHEYYVEVAELIGAEVPLTAEQVLLTSYRMQTLLQKHGEAQESGTEMILFGSFVNGKAVAKTSDLDYAVTTARMEEILSAENIKPLLKEFDFSEAQPHLVLHRNIHELGFLNPLIIIITENQISLRIYEELNTQDLHGRRILFDEYYF